MTQVTIHCPDCEYEFDIIIEAIDEQEYECMNCGNEIVVFSDIKVISKYE